MKLHYPSTLVRFWRKVLDIAGGFPAASLGTGVLGDFRRRNDTAGGFPVASLGAGWFQRRNNTAGGFPTASLGAEVVLGRK
jgi:hypothetical protein